MVQIGLKYLWQKRYIFLSFALLFVVLVLPVVVFAADSKSIELPNPIGIKDPRELIGRIISAFLGIVGSIALVIFIWGGFLWMTSAGNAERVTKGKNAILWAALGLAIIFSSYVIVKNVLDALNKKSTLPTPGGGTTVTTPP